MGSTADLSSFRGSMTNLGSSSLRHLSTSLMDFSQAPSKQSINSTEQSDKPRYYSIVEPLLKDPPRKGQPLYNGQNGWSQSVL